MLGEETGFIVENAVITVIEGMEEVGVILEEVVFEAGLVIILDRSGSRNREDRRSWRQSEIKRKRNES